MKGGSLCLKSPHGESGNGAGSAVRESTVFLVNERNAVFRKYKIYSSSGRMLACVRQKCIAIIHDKNHFLTLTGGDQIVHNVVDLALPDPSGFGFTAAVLQIQNRIMFFWMCFIARRRIDKAGAVSSGHGTVVIIHPDSAVWDVLKKIKTRVRIRNFKIIDSAEIAVADWSEVIAHACAIDDIIMIMKTCRKPFSSAGPVAIFLSIKRNSFRKGASESLHSYGMCAGSTEDKVYGSVAINAGAGGNRNVFAHRMSVWICDTDQILLCGVKI